MFDYFKDNALQEWAFKRAVTIEAYDDYDPIPVPLNIIYSLGKLLWQSGRITNDSNTNSNTEPVILQRILTSWCKVITIQYKVNKWSSLLWMRFKELQRTVQCNAMQYILVIQCNTIQCNTYTCFAMIQQCNAMQQNTMQKIWFISFPQLYLSV